MAQVIRLIWRLDFPSSYAYLDHRGRALEALSNTVSKFWDSVGDGALNLSFVGRGKRSDHTRNMSLEVGCLNGSIEWGAGSGLARILETDAFRGMDGITKRLLQVCEIKAVNRVGIRFSGVANYADGRKGAHERVMALIDPKLREGLVSSLGEIQDVGLIFDGKAPDNVNFRAQFGQYEQKNAELTLGRQLDEKEAEALKEFDLFFDIDLYETNISFAELTLYRWAATKVEKALRFAAMCSGEEVKSLEGSDGGRSKRQRGH